MESIVKVEHLSHRYTVDWAIQDINFEVNRKGILGYWDPMVQENRLQ